MSKSQLVLIVFVIVSLVAIFSIYQFGLFDVGLAPRVYSSCITPPAYPGVITQSGNICPGTYPYGIGIGASNIKVTCPPAASATIFDGNTWVGKNGLKIMGQIK
ncbi:MAG: hypothetical protein AABX94_01655 [Nanoarchaeota archaeon]